ncbi:Retrovirus-related Pol polyprotein from transposon TNT 1-94 [Vitis vinifera]|uniref:Retrovirus-related Pol polyprotein from transposon TNT 1-94 n=1 Tax=Vitis vinifera TaxID=29760 RepID=A0A438ELA5_VITVI|nr:Retrovirus-related Pol polyprotein from transposon TNT 1-94 [Vitis vinifera]
MKALQKNDTWALVPLPEGKKTVGCRWVFSIKHKTDGSVERYKVRLIAKGYTQTYGVDYQETLSPIVKLNTVRVLISLAANLDWPLHQFDVKNVFFHGDLEDEVYMDIPQGFVSSTQGKVVCKLQKTFYRLKQSPRAWFGQFSLAMRKHGFKQRMLDCRPADTPIVQNHGLGEFPNQTLTNKERYQRLVGKLIYLSHTQPDIAYAVSLVSQFMHCPSKDHMSAVVRILRYLKSSPGRGLMFTKSQHLHIDGYMDADWAGNITDRKSTSGYFTFVEGNLAAIAIAHNPVQHDRTKHVEVDRHFIKQKLEDKVIQFPFVKSEDQLADILTKKNTIFLLLNSINYVECQLSGGHCGFDENNDAICFCPDRPHTTHCNDSEAKNN